MKKVISLLLAAVMSGHRIIHIVKTSYHLFLLSGLFQDELHFLPAGERETCFNDQTDLCGRAGDLFRLLEVSCLLDLREAGKWIKREKVRPINEAKRYITQHYAEPLNLDGICSQVGLSPNYFSTLFRKETGKTFLEFLLEIRINAAKELLRETRQTTDAVCESVGIHDLCNAGKILRFPLPHPQEFRRCEAGKGDVGRTGRERLPPHRVVEPGCLLGGPAVVPQNGGTDDPVLRVQHHQSVHLPAEADARHLFPVVSGQQGLQSIQNRAPPVLRPLFRPAGVREEDRVLPGNYIADRTVSRH